MPWQLRGTIPGPAGGGTGGWVDEYGFAVDYTAPGDTLTAPVDDATMAVDAGYDETQAAPDEAATFGFSGYGDTTATPVDTKGSRLLRWATSNTTGGTTAPTNPANAHGENNGTVAQCKAGGLSNGTSTLTVTIAAPMPEIGSGSTRTLRAYYAFNAGVTDTCAASVSYRQAGQGTNTVLALPSTGNYITPGTTLSLTNIDPAVAITATFTHSATTPASGGSVTVDAVGVETTGTL